MLYNYRISRRERMIFKVQTQVEIQSAKYDPFWAVMTLKIQNDNI